MAAFPDLLGLAAWWEYVVWGVPLLLVAVFLILLVLVQRGRGGGLTGALGGMGGQSAFGTKAGDNFTWLTFATAAAWILLCIFALIRLGTPVVADDDPSKSPELESPADDGNDADGSDASDE